MAAAAVRFLLLAGVLTTAPALILPRVAHAEVRVEGNIDSVRLEARDASVGEALEALSAAFGLLVQNSAGLDRRISGTYRGSLRQVVSGLLAGRNYVAIYSGGRVEIRDFGAVNDAQALSALTPSAIAAMPSGVRTTKGRSSGRPASNVPAATLPAVSAEPTTKVRSSAPTSNAAEAFLSSISGGSTTKTAAPTPSSNAAEAFLSSISGGSTTKTAAPTPSSNAAEAFLSAISGGSTTKTGAPTPSSNAAEAFLSAISGGSTTKTGAPTPISTLPAPSLPAVSIQPTLVTKTQDTSAPTGPNSAP